MNILIDGAPDTVEIDGREWKVNTDFRVFLLLEELMYSDTVPDRFKTAYALSYFYPQIPPNVDAAVRQLLRFYRGGEEEEQGEDSGKKTEKPVFSFTQDAKTIYAAFWKEYRIDLTREEIHWWKFKALLTPLVSGVAFSDIVRFRAVKITRGMGKEEASHYRRMKKLYALKEKEDAGEKLGKNYAAFKNDILEKAERRRLEVQKQAKEKSPG